eukprot:7273905-Prymnesium_polylepis.1
MPTCRAVRGANVADARLRWRSPEGVRAARGRRGGYEEGCGGRAVGEPLGEGWKRSAQAASVPPPREGEDRKHGRNGRCVRRPGAFRVSLAEEAQ